MRRVLVLGGGHAGTEVARRLHRRSRPRELQVTLVSRDNAELWHGLMPQLLGGAVQPQHVLVPLRERLPGVSVHVAEVQHIDLEGHSVTIGRGGERSHLRLEFDDLVLALGSVADLTRFPGMAEHALPAKTIADFMHIRNHLVDMLEAAAVENNPVERRRLLTFVVAGAGFAGVETVCEAASFVRGALQLYPGIAAAELRFLLVDLLPRVLPAVSEGLAAQARQQLDRDRIEVHLGCGLAAATGTAVTLSDGEIVPTSSLVATAGTAPNPVLAALSIPIERGRIRCDQLGRVEGRRALYAVGDCAGIPGPDGRSYPPMVRYALAEGRAVADVILASIRGTLPRPIRCGLGPEVAILGRGHGVAQVGPLALHGWPASLAGGLIFLSYLPSWHRRTRLLLDWLSGALMPADVTRLGRDRSDALVAMRFDTGDVILREGEPAERFYIVDQGEVEVSSGGRPVRRLGPGDWFGEVALRERLPRTATVQATRPTLLLSIVRTDFAALVAHLEPLRDALDRQALGRSGELPPTGADVTSALP